MGQDVNGILMMLCIAGTGLATHGARMEASRFDASADDAALASTIDEVADEMDEQERASAERLERLANEATASCRASGKCSPEWLYLGVGKSPCCTLMLGDYSVSRGVLVGSKSVLTHLAKNPNKEDGKAIRPSSLTSCNSLLSGPDRPPSAIVERDCPHLPVRVGGGGGPPRDDNHALLLLPDPDEFVRLRESYRQKPEKGCKLDPEVCVTKDGASFSIGCEGGPSLEVSTSGEVSVGMRVGKVDVSVGL